MSLVHFLKLDLAMLNSINPTLESFENCVLEHLPWTRNEWGSSMAVAAPSTKSRNEAITTALGPIGAVGGNGADSTIPRVDLVRRLIFRCGMYLCA